MSNRLRQLALALTLSGFTALACAQAAPDDGAAGAGPGASGNEHGWQDAQHGDHNPHGGDHRQWADHEGAEHGWRDHHHHHHHRHHHRGWGEGQARHDGGPGMMDGAGMMGGAGMMAGAGLLRSFHSLNLSPAQHQQVQSILANERAQFWKERANQKPGSAPDFAALANPGDPGFAVAVQAAKKRAADRIQHASDLKTQLYSVLTTEQKAQLSKNLADWKAHRMAQHGEGAKGGPAPAAR